MRRRKASVEKPGNAAVAADVKPVTSGAIRVTTGPAAPSVLRPGTRPDMMFRMNARLTRVGKSVGIWLAVAVFFSTQNVLVRRSSGSPINWQWDVAHEFIYWLTWAALTPAILWTARRWRLERGSGVRRLVPHFVAMLCAGPVSIVAAYSLHLLVFTALGLIPPDGAAAWIAQRRPGIVWGTLTGFLYYWILIGVYHAIVYQRLYRAEKVAAAEVAAQLAQARLDSLAMQLQPHFLFNTLNSISVLTAEDPQKANRMLLRLSELLRLTLDGTAKHEVSLGEELLFLERYLEIQRVRFEDRLAVVFEIEPAARAARVPCLLLQPLAENAIRHGIEQDPGGGTLTVLARRSGDDLKLEVRDNGRGLREAAGVRDGLGLVNTRARLSQLYGARQRLEVNAPASGGVCVAITLPFRTA